MVNVLLHRCCAAQMDSRRKLGRGAVTWSIGTLYHCVASDEGRTSEDTNVPWVCQGNVNTPPPLPHFGRGAYHLPRAQ